MNPFVKETVKLATQSLVVSAASVAGFWLGLEFIAGTMTRQDDKKTTTENG